MTYPFDPTPPQALRMRHVHPAIKEAPVLCVTDPSNRSVDLLRVDCSGSYLLTRRQQRLWLRHADVPAGRFPYAGFRSVLVRRLK